MSDETGGHLEAIMSDILMWGGGNSCCRTNILKLLGSISIIKFADVSKRKYIYLLLFIEKKTRCRRFLLSGSARQRFNHVWVPSSIAVSGWGGELKAASRNETTPTDQRQWRRDVAAETEKITIKYEGRCKWNWRRCSNMWLPLSRDSLSHSETQFLCSLFPFFFSLPLQSESDVSHHLACLQRERVAGARRPTLGVSRVMLLPLWQSHIPPAARQLTGSHKSPQIGPKKATKAIFSRHKATGIK